uniref:Uncharacterized protein n=1 Tax=Oryza meridionalis TaxID=40149 RepID=A0A0E0DT25_9ORYZ
MALALRVSLGKTELVVDTQELGAVDQASGIRRRCEDIKRRGQRMWRAARSEVVLEGPRARRGGERPRGGRHFVWWARGMATSRIPICGSGGARQRLGYMLPHLRRLGAHLHPTVWAPVLLTSAATAAAPALAHQSSLPFHRTSSPAQNISSALGLAMALSIRSAMASSPSSSVLNGMSGRGGSRGCP